MKILIAHYHTKSVKGMSILMVTICYDKNMRIEIDQSGKIEDTNRLTVIAYSNKEFKSISITGKDKREIQVVYRKIHQPKIFYYKLFAILVFSLIKNKLKSLDQIIIDKEYPGYEKLIISFIAEIALKFNIKFDKSIVHFKSIGKKSKAHRISNDAYRVRKADLKLTAQEFYKIAFK